MKNTLRQGTKSVSTTEYGRKLMMDMMMVYDGNQKRYAYLVGHGYRILAKAVEKNLAYEIKCPHMVICGKEDRAGSCIRYLKSYEKNREILLSGLIMLGIIPTQIDQML